MLALTNATLTTLFAAIAAAAAFGSIVQAGFNHRRDTRDRADERRERRDQFEREAKERRDEFDRETEERHQAFEEERRARLIEQLVRISDRVAIVRETAKEEAATDGKITSPMLGAIAVDYKQIARYFWNARKQLEASLAAYKAIGGTAKLDECWNLATGSTMDHLGTVIGTCTGAFDELARASEDLQQTAGGST